MNLIKFFKKCLKTRNDGRCVFFINPETNSLSIDKESVKRLYDKLIKKMRDNNEQEKL